MKIGIRLEFKWQDFWIGVFHDIKTETVLVPTPYVVAPSGARRVWSVPRGCRVLHIWVCLLPMLPIHISMPLNKALKDETNAVSETPTLFFAWFAALTGFVIGLVLEHFGHNLNPWQCFATFFAAVLAALFLCLTGRLKKNL